MVYGSKQMSRAEVEAMLGLTLQETRVYQEIKAEGKAEGEQIGRQMEAASLALKLLVRRLNQDLSLNVRSHIQALPLPQLESLIETLLDFTCLADLLTWLETNSSAKH
jgi:predicted transposase YdaD